jgi:hypothetical protein
MDYLGTSKSRGRDLASTSLKRENVKRPQREDARREMATESPGKQKHMWKNPFLNKGFHKRDQKHPPALHGEPEFSVQYGNGVGTHGIDDIARVGQADEGDMSLRDLLPDRSTEIRVEPVRTSHSSNMPNVDENDLVDSSESSARSTASGEELAFGEQDRTLDLEHRAILSARPALQARSSYSGVLSPRFSGENGSTNLQNSVSLQTDPTRIRSRPRMSAKDSVMLQLLQERNAPTDLPPALMPKRGSKGGSYD